MGAADIINGAQRFADPDQAARALAQRVGEIIDYAVGARGRASLLVPGGRTPIPFFRALRDIDLPWGSVYISLTDERRVPADDAASNARLIREHLLTGLASAAHFHPLHREGIDARADEAVCGAALSMLPRPFDAVILGMGEDGHTASLFPDDPALDRGMDLNTTAHCVATTAPDEPRARLSLTLHALASSRWIAVHLHGQEKWQTLQHATADGDARRYPILAVLEQKQVPIHVYWSA